jgi:hypothetical protein
MTKFTEPEILLLANLYLISPILEENIGIRKETHRRPLMLIIEAMRISLLATARIGVIKGVHGIIELVEFELVEIPKEN